MTLIVLGSWAGFRGEFFVNTAALRVFGLFGFLVHAIAVLLASWGLATS